MAVLSRESIRDAISAGDIVITPFDGEIGPASIDLTLSNEFRYYERSSSPVEVNESVDYIQHTSKVVVDNENDHDAGYLLLPGQACLGITVESVRLSPGICGLLEGRSRFARMGLFVHITAGFMQPGIDNRQVLEIFNASHNALLLKPGTKICQFIFMRMEGEATYAGRFAEQAEL